MSHDDVDAVMRRLFDDAPAAAGTDEPDAGGHADEHTDGGDGR